MKKYIFKILIIFIIIVFMTFYIYADDEMFEENVSLDSIYVETSSTISNEPTINARHAIIFDRNSKTCIYGKSENEQCKMASTTKIMTAIIVIENTNLDDIVEVSSRAAGTGGSRLGLAKNAKVSVKHLLYGLMLKSGNDAAVALSEHTGGSVENFALMMNKKANELNLLNTHFVTPHGLDNYNHYTSAFDLAILSDYALNNEIFSKIVKTKTYTVLINNQPITISNTNELLGNFEGIYGIKTGFTNGANRCLVTVCKRGNLDFICIVLGCDTKKDRTRDSVKLLNYAFKNFSLINIKDIALKKFNEWNNIHKNSFFINKGISQKLDLFLDEKDITFSNIAIKSTDIDSVNVEIIFDSYFESPLYENTQIGKMHLYVNSKEFYSIDILNNNKIMKKNIFDYITYFFKNYCNFFLKNSSI